MAPTPTQIRDPFTGYGLISILLHWLTAIAVVALYLTHDREGSAMHLSIGLAVAPLFLWRLHWRAKRGYPRVPEQSAFFNFVERLVMLGFLACFLAVTATRGRRDPPAERKAVRLLRISSLSPYLSPPTANWRISQGKSTISPPIPFFRLSRCTLPARFIIASSAETRLCCAFCGRFRAASEILTIWSIYRCNFRENNGSIYFCVRPKRRAIR